jgi:hypothetical protein
LEANPFHSNFYPPSGLKRSQGYRIVLAAWACQVTLALGGGIKAGKFNRIPCAEGREETFYLSCFGVGSPEEQVQQVAIQRN